MSEKTTAALAMDEVARRVTPLLKEAGFKKRRRAYNRAIAPGVVQVVSFQMSHAHSGRFTLNLGVYVESLRTKYLATLAVSSWINEYDCQLRKRIGALLPGGKDTWWQVDDIEAATCMVQAALTQYGLPWLDQRRAQTGILVDTYTAAHEYRLEHPRAKSFVRLQATICANEQEAQRLMQQALAAARVQPGFVLQDEAPVLEIGDIAVLIRANTANTTETAAVFRTLVTRQGRLVLRLQAQHPAEARRPVSLEPTARWGLVNIQQRYMARGRAYPTPIALSDDGASAPT